MDSYMFMFPDPEEGEEVVIRRMNICKRVKEAHVYLLIIFCSFVMNSFGPEYLRKPMVTHVVNIIDITKKSTGQYARRDHGSNPFILLEAVASQDYECGMLSLVLLGGTTTSTGLKIEFCFFDGWAENFTKYADNCELLGHVVLILQLAKVKYAEVDGYDPKNHSITVFSPQKIVTPDNFLEGYDVQTPFVSAAKTTKFSSGDTIPFNLEVTPIYEKGNQHSGASSRSSRNGNRTIIDLDGYEEKEATAKKGEDGRSETRA
nr:replication protein A 70 kDa DNA-binding subunit B [Tanacetum cinerariifolium]